MREWLLPVPHQWLWVAALVFGAVSQYCSSAALSASVHLSCSTYVGSTHDAGAHGTCAYKSGGTCGARVSLTMASTAAVARVPARRESAVTDYCSTINNWTEENYALLTNLVPTAAKYLFVGKETGENSTPHLQGFIQLARRSRLAQVSRILGGRAHVERRRGSLQEAIRYCAKDGDFQEWGVKPATPGGKLDLEDISGRLQRGETCREVYDAQPKAYILFQCGIHAARTMSLSRPRGYHHLRCSVYYGSTGTGKTRAAYNRFAARDHYMWTPSMGKWWQRYDGERYVICDEFQG